VLRRGEDVLAFVFIHDFIDDGLGLMTGGSHDGVVIVQRDHGQDDVGGERVRGPYEGFRATGAFQTVQPEYRHAGLRLQRMGHLGSDFGSKAERGSGQAAKFHETATRDPLPPQDVIECFRHDWRSSSQNAFSGASADRTAPAHLAARVVPSLSLLLNSIAYAKPYTGFRLPLDCNLSVAAATAETDLPPVSSFFRRLGHTAGLDSRS